MFTIIVCENCSNSYVSHNDSIFQYFTMKLVEKASTLDTSTGRVIIEGYKLLKFENCDASRFAGLAEEIGITSGNDTRCVEKDFEMKLKGTLSSISVTQLILTVDYCDQELLDKLLPGQGKKCRSKADANKIIDKVMIINGVLEFYLDQGEMFANPVKPQPNVDSIFFLKKDTNIILNSKLAENTVTLYDSWLQEYAKPTV